MEGVTCSQEMFRYFRQIFFWQAMLFLICDRISEIGRGNFKNRTCLAKNRFQTAQNVVFGRKKRFLAKLLAEGMVQSEEKIIQRDQMRKTDNE